MTTRVEIHMHVTDPPLKETWYSARDMPCAAYGVIDLGGTLLFLDSESLDRLARSVDLLIRERDEKP